MHFFTNWTYLKLEDWGKKKWHHLLVLYKYGWPFLKSNFLTVDNNSYQKFLYERMPFLYKHRAFYFRCKMLLLKEMKWFYPFVLKAVQGVPYPLLVCYNLLLFY